MNPNRRIKFQKNIAQKIFQNKQKDFLKSPKNIKLIIKKRKQTKSNNKEYMEESNETFIETSETIVFRKSNALIREIIKNKTSSIPKDKAYLKRSHSPNKTSLSSSFSKTN